MDFNITAGEDVVVFHVASLVQDGLSPTDDDLAEELGEEVRPVLQPLMGKGWLVVDEDRELALSTIARHVVSSRTDAEGPRA
ncbi:hypothetical protein [Streptomyces sp. NRRL S-1448]|uniref:hypothetical protein n=1 Tax=Streptomyces sp. NRRL S-1448 TaxID=1463883 RepID=UPI0005677A8D|nr:hypothetical protein [Streptomyces sp. NRRL S-1448]